MRVAGLERGWGSGGKTLMAYVSGGFDFVWPFLLQMERNYLASNPLMIGTLTATCLSHLLVQCTVVPQSLINEFFYRPRTPELKKFMELFLDLVNFASANS